MQERAETLKNNIDNIYALQTKSMQPEIREVVSEHLNSLTNKIKQEMHHKIEILNQKVLENVKFREKYGVQLAEETKTYEFLEKIRNS